MADEQSVEGDRFAGSTRRLGEMKQFVGRPATQNGTVLWPEPTDGGAGTARPQAFKTGRAGLDAVVAVRQGIEVGS